MCNGHRAGACLALPLRTLTRERLEQAILDSPTGTMWARDVELADVVAALAAPRLQVRPVPPRQTIPVALFASGGLVEAAGFMTLGMFPTVLRWWVAAPLLALGVALLVFAAVNHALQLRWRRMIAPEVARERRLAIATWSRHNLTYERLTLCPSCGKVSDPLTGAQSAWPRAWRLIYDIDSGGAR